MKEMYGGMSEWMDEMNEWVDDGWMK